MELEFQKHFPLTCGIEIEKRYCYTKYLSKIEFIDEE